LTHNAKITGKQKNYSYTFSGFLTQKIMISFNNEPEEEEIKQTKTSEQYFIFVLKRCR